MRSAHRIWAAGLLAALPRPLHQPGVPKLHLPPLQDAAERGIAAWPSTGVEAGSLGSVSMSSSRPGPVTASTVPPPTDTASAAGESTVAFSQGSGGVAPGPAAAAYAAYRSTLGQPGAAEQNGGNGSAGPAPSAFGPGADEAE